MLSSETFLQKITALENRPAQKKFLLAVSGGVDSMVLMHLFQALGFEFQVAHVNYKLRAESSDLDQKMVEDYCSRNGIKCHVYEVSETDEKPESSVQLWARNLRYEFFFSILDKEKIDFIVTAHHLNDELETFLINLSRGSGIRGLSGIPASENRIFRPLLDYSKKEIYSFAEENDIPFREDESNAKNDYLRNRFRNTIIPEIEKISPKFLEQFGNSLSYLNDANRFIQNETEKKIAEVSPGFEKERFTINKKELLASEHFIITEIIRRLGFSGDEINKVISAENGKFFRSKTHEIRITANEIVADRRR